MSGVVYCVPGIRSVVYLGIRSIVYWVLGHWVLRPYALDANSMATAEKTLQMHFKVAGRNFYAFLVQAGDSLTDALRVVSVLWL